MSAVLFRCPKTGKSLDIGLETDAESIAALGSQIVKLDCQFCGEHHVFEMKDARLRDYRLASKHFFKTSVARHESNFEAQNAECFLSSGFQQPFFSNRGTNPSNPQLLAPEPRCRPTPHGL